MLKLVRLTMAGFILFGAGSALAQDFTTPTESEVSPKCEASIDRAAGGYARCLLNAQAEFATRGNEHTLERRRAECEESFAARVEKAMGSNGDESCTHDLLIESIANRSTSFADAVASEASGQSATELKWEFAQSAATGSISFMPDPKNPGGEPLGMLTLDATDQVLAFTDRPNRLVGYLPNAEFQDLWRSGSGNGFDSNPPNAVLHFGQNSGSSYSDLPLVLESASYVQIDGQKHTMIYEIRPDGPFSFSELSEEMRDNVNCRSIEVETPNSSGTEMARSCTLERPELFIDGWSLKKGWDGLKHDASHAWHKTKEQLDHAAHSLATSYERNLCTITATSTIMLLLFTNPAFQTIEYADIASAVGSGSVVRFACTSIGEAIWETHSSFNVQHFTTVCDSVTRVATNLQAALAHVAACLICGEPVSR